MGNMENTILAVDKEESIHIAATVRYRITSGSSIGNSGGDKVSSSPGGGDDKASENEVDDEQSAKLSNRKSCSVIGDCNIEERYYKELRLSSSKSSSTVEADNFVVISKNTQEEEEQDEQLQQTAGNNGVTEKMHLLSEENTRTERGADKIITNAFGNGCNKSCEGDVRTENELLLLGFENSQSSDDNITSTNESKIDEQTDDECLISRRAEECFDNKRSNVRSIVIESENVYSQSSFSTLMHDENQPSIVSTDDEGSSSSSIRREKLLEEIRNFEVVDLFKVATLSRRSLSGNYQQDDHRRLLPKDDISDENDSPTLKGNRNTEIIIDKGADSKELVVVTVNSGFGKQKRFDKIDSSLIIKEEKPEPEPSERNIHLGSGGAYEEFATNRNAVVVQDEAIVKDGISNTASNIQTDVEPTRRDITKAVWRRVSSIFVRSVENYYL